jgi:hypothetical protein
MKRLYEDISTHISLKEVKSYDWDRFKTLFFLI